MPFRCPYCGGYFCSAHRLPENHECPQLALVHLPKVERQPVTVQKQKSYEYTVSYGPFESTRGKIHFSGKEVKHLAIAALLVVGIGLSIGTFPGFYDVDETLMLGVFTLILTVSFFMHEIAHKIVAQRSGLWAEFRLTVMGAILTLFSIISPFFKIISPGAVMVAGFADKENLGRISIAGPATNLIVSTIFLMATFLFPQYYVIFLLCAAFNAWIALFNLVPFGMLDGFKIFLWNKKYWALAFTTSLMLTVISYKMLS